MFGRFRSETNHIAFTDLLVSGSSPFKIRKNEIHSQSGVEFTPEKRPALLRIAANFTLGQWIGALELPTATAVAIPMISHEVDRRFL
ncbi:hypothetical protein [Neorhizobium alkalisoli]|uniref:Uncharacterized protein n=1 Tax=Neorhizobium alkalisoli TaxID=528178 RepID=A0A561QBT8_9HYPH|nr:hypothetical protein [Neorhizobium alkalisoli]TWF47834.1 hypothetical protein FHW37_110131 [Neorhizobium alkalisoli]